MAKSQDKMLAERGSNYGDFFDHALTAQRIKAEMERALMNNSRMASLQENEKAVVLEGLGMIAHKIGRIVNGDLRYEDSWIDIEGYSRITRERVCKGEKDAE